MLSLRPSAKIFSREAKSAVPISSVLLVSFFVAGVVIGVRQAGILQPLELVAFDAMVQLAPPAPPDPRILVVGITEDDIRDRQRFPLTDSTIATLITTLQKQQPKTIGLDIYRDIPYPPAREQLLKQLQADNVIAIAKLQDDKGQSIPPPPGVPKERIGFNDFVFDSDNVLRRNLMYVELDDRKYYSFALQISLNYLKKQNKNNHYTFKTNAETLQIGRATFFDLTPDAGGYQTSSLEMMGWQILLHYLDPDRAFRQVTLGDVLDGKVDPNWIKDKIVIVGTVAPSAKDLYATPYTAKATENYLMPGAIVHAQMVSQILGIVLNDRPQFWFWTQWHEWLWIAVWAIVGGFLGWRWHHPLTLSLVVAIAGGILWSIGLIFFAQMAWIPVIPPAIALVATSASVLSNKLSYSNYHDALTGLANRRLFLQKLQKLNRKQKPENSTIAILFLDLDRFKRINDGLGREAGDWLLLNVSRRLQAQLAGIGQLARVGGDEFAVCVGASADLALATRLADYLQKELTYPFIWQGQEIYTSVSIGIAYNRTGKDFDAEELLRNADIAMYQAKELGKARHQIFASGMRTEAESRWQLETEMRNAIARQEFQLYYQPIISLKTLQIAGFEALIRWNSPQRGFVPPDTFVPIAEETGLIVPIGQWIMREACSQMNRWQKQFPQHSALMMSVNLSPRQFLQIDLVERIEQILDETQVKRNCLKLEITESLMMKDLEAGLKLLDRLKSLGLRLSLDDFGTGYSSLSNLHTFPIDTLKIDRAFVNRLNDDLDSQKYTQIVRTIVMLGHNLALEVIAEGVETAHQARALKIFNCEYGQGYLFGKPLSKQGATKLLQKDPQWEL
jgi:diguanylate cyclase (GGDEF)-like protein